MGDIPIRPPSGKSWFPDGFWKRPKLEVEKRGEPTNTRLFQAIGGALTDFEKSQEHLAHLYQHLSGLGPQEAKPAVRTFGTIENIRTRTDAIMAVAELYFGQHWKLPVKKCFSALMRDVNEASYRRNDIAHGTVINVRTFVESGRPVNKTSGHMLVAPSYMTGRTSSNPILNPNDEFSASLSDYRFDRQVVVSFGEKFVQLSNVIIQVAHRCMKDQETGLPRLIRVLKEADPSRLHINE